MNTLPVASTLPLNDKPLSNGGHVLRVGQLYTPRRTNWPDGADYNYRSGVHELRLFLRDATEHEQEQVLHGAATFQVGVHGDVILLGFTFGDLPQGYSTFSKYLVPEDERRDPPDLSDGAQGLRWRNRVLTVILVEGTTGIVLGLRTLALPIYFLRVLHRLIREQAWNGNERYDEQISEVVIRIAALDALPRSLVLSTCVVGRKQERPVTKESLSELEWVLTSGSAADGTAVYTVRTDLLQVWMYQEKDNWYTVLVRFDGTVRQRGMQPEAGEDLFQCATEVARTLLAAMLLPYIAIAFPEMLNAQTPD